MGLKTKPRMIFGHMRAAEGYAASSYAQRLKVGCIIIDPDTDQPVSIGWNGTAPGAPNVCERIVNGELVSCCVVHAEENALSRIPGTHDSRSDLVMFVTHSPCPDCTKMIIRSRQVSTVVYRNEYRIPDGIIQLLGAGIKVFMVPNEIDVLRVFAEEGNLHHEHFCLNPDLGRV